MTTALKSADSASKQSSRIKVRCSHCGRVLVAKSTAAGKTVACPDCKETITIPTRETVQRSRQQKQRRQAAANVNRTFGLSNMMTVMVFSCLIVGLVGVALLMMLGMPRAGGGCGIALMMGLVGVIRRRTPVLRIADGAIETMPNLLWSVQSCAIADVVKITRKKCKVTLTTGNGGEVLFMTNMMDKSQRDDAVALLSQVTGRPIEDA